MSDEAEAIEIDFRPPVYASTNVKFPILSQELIEFIADYLWDEPMQLARCCLVCHAWYRAAIYHLRTVVNVRSKKAMNNLVHTLVAKRQSNSRFARALKSLVVAQDFGEPFAHTFSLRLPGYLLGALEALEFSRLDWTASTYHPNFFFKYLTQFTSVTTLYFWRCRFPRGGDFKKVVCTLPNLTALNVESVTFGRVDSGGTPKSPEHKPDSSVQCILRRPKLRELCLWGRTTVDGDYLATTGRCDVEHLHASVLDVLSKCSTDAVELRLSTTQFLSFSQLRRFIRTFPHLRVLALEGVPEWDVPEPSAGTALLATNAKLDAWDKLELSDMSSAVAGQLIRVFNAQYRKIQQLYISLLEMPCSALRRAVTELTEGCGPVLRRFHWEILAHSTIKASRISSAQQTEYPIPSLLAGSTHLTHLEVTLCATSPLSTVWVQNTLLTLFTHIGSTRLQRVLLHFALPPSVLTGFDPSLYAPLSARSIAVFHAALSRENFAQLHNIAPSDEDGPPIEITFRAQVMPPPENTASELTELIIDFMEDLFEPWMQLGLVYLELPDNSAIDYRSEFWD